MHFTAIENVSWRKWWSNCGRKPISKSHARPLSLQIILMNLYWKRFHILSTHYALQYYLESGVLYCRLQHDTVSWGVVEFSLYLLFISCDISLTSTTDEVKANQRRWASSWRNGRTCGAQKWVNRKWSNRIINYKSTYHIYLSIIAQG